MPASKPSTQKKVLADDLSGFEDLLSQPSPSPETPLQAPPAAPEVASDRDTPKTHQERVQAAGLSTHTEQQLAQVGNTTKPIVDVTPSQLPPLSPMETLVEVAELLARHSADDYFILDSEKVAEILKDHKQVIDVIQDKVNTDRFRINKRYV